MDEFLKTLRMLVEFPLTMETTSEIGTYFCRRRQWQWYFRDESMVSSRTYGTHFSRFYDDGSPMVPYGRYYGIAGYAGLLRQQLAAVVEEIIADG